MAKQPDDARRYPLLPLRGLLIFPSMVLHFDVGRDKSIKALEHAMLDEHLTRTGFTGRRTNR